MKRFFAVMWLLTPPVILLLTLVSPSFSEYTEGFFSGQTSIDELKPFLPD